MTKPVAKPASAAPVAQPTSQPQPAQNPSSPTASPNQTFGARASSPGPAGNFQAPQGAIVMPAPSSSSLIPSNATITQIHPGSAQGGVSINYNVPGAAPAGASGGGPVIQAPSPAPAPKPSNPVQKAATSVFGDIATGFSDIFTAGAKAGVAARSGGAGSGVLQDLGVVKPLPSGTPASSLTLFGAESTFLGARERA